jgi:outer membrane protein TolC
MYFVTRHHNVYFRTFTLLLILTVLFLLAGCGVSREARSYVEQDMNGIFNREIRNLIKDDLPINKTAEIKFFDAFSLAVKRDERIRYSNIARQKSLIDMKQAESVIWPRFFAEISFEVPINKKGGEDNSTFGGGVFIKYDILNAAFYDDAISIESAKSKQASLQEEAALQDVYYDLIQALAELELRHQEISAWSSALDAARKGLERAIVLSNSTFGSLSDMRTWEREVRRMKLNHQEVNQNLSSLISTLRLKLGLGLRSEIHVSDSHQYFPQLEEYEPAHDDIQAKVLKAWQQRNDIKIAEINLFLAKMGINQAKQKRLPQISTSLGLGNIILRSNEGSAPIVPFIGFSAPLIDMGDISRGVKKAELYYDSVKEDIMALALKLVADTQDAVAQMTLSAEQLKEAQQVLNTEQKNVEIQNQLLTAHRTDPLDLFKAKLSADEASVDYYRSLYAYRKAVIRLEKLIGNPVKDEILSLWYKQFKG